MPSDSGSVITSSTVLALVNISSLAANGLVFVLFYRKPTLRTFSNGFVLGLSVCHLVQSVLQMPYIVLPRIFGGWIFGEVWCKITASLSICFSLATAFSLLLIAMDRSYAVNNPLHYTMITTKKIIAVKIASVWVLSLILSSAPLFGLFRVEYRNAWSTCAVAWYEGTPRLIIYSTILTLCGLLVPLVKLSSTYRSMYIAARKNGARAFIYPHRRKPASLKMMGEWRAVRTPLMVISSHIIASFPLHLVAVIESYAKIQIQHPWLMTVVTLATFSSSIINPYLYVFRNKSIRKELRKLFRSKSYRLTRSRANGKPHNMQWVWRRSKEDVASNSSEETLPASTGETKGTSFDNPVLRTWVENDINLQTTSHCPISSSESNISKLGQAKRNSFVMTRMGNSSDTTLTSTSSDSQDFSFNLVCSSRPKLFRHSSATETYHIQV